jgi:isocitrate/isopropylmalate dehydrogenase
MSLIIDVKLVSLPGDGIGIEVVSGALALRAAGYRWDVRLVLDPVDAASPVLAESESSTLLNCAG